MRQEIAPNANIEQSTLLSYEVNPNIMAKDYQSLWSDCNTAETHHPGAIRHPDSRKSMEMILYLTGQPR